jgi:hypothetical protein
MQKITFSNHRQCGAFLKTYNFKKLTCDFAKHLTAFLKITFSNLIFLKS